MILEPPRGPPPTESLPRTDARLLPSSIPHLCRGNPLKPSSPCSAWLHRKHRTQTHPTCRNRRRENVGSTFDEGVVIGNASVGERSPSIKKKSPNTRTSALTLRTYLHTETRERPGQSWSSHAFRAAFSRHRSRREGCPLGNGGAAPSSGCHAQKTLNLLWISFPGCVSSLLAWAGGTQWNTSNREVTGMLRLKPPGVATRHLYWLYSRIIFWHV